MPSWEVSKNESGVKLLAFLKSKLGDLYSLRQLKKTIEGNSCLVNQRTERFASSLLGMGDHVTISLESILTTPLGKLRVEKARVLYEDDYLLIYDKPAGISSEDLEFHQILRSYAPILDLTHRLDRDTTGVLVFAKTKESFAGMLKLFKERSVDKTYLAIVDGIMEKKNGTIKNYLGEKKSYQGQTIRGEVQQSLGKSAWTDWVLEKKGDQASLVRCFPKTGRTHQIRVHLSGIGHPILGDYQYGKQFRCSYRPQRSLLHALSIVFSHPITNQKIRVEAPVPNDFFIRP